MQGDPRRACISAACQYNEDCDDNQICNRPNRVCQPVCSENTCAPNAICITQKHRAICTCPPGHTGDAYLHGCSILHDTTECATDFDCASPLACVNSLCTDLCSGNPCVPGLICNTVDILPLRAVACICPDGGRVAPDSSCRAPPEAECSSDSNCANSQICHRSSCVEACRSDPCGRNALCESVDHMSRCSCPLGYIGNPRIECNSGNFFFYSFINYLLWLFNFLHLLQCHKRLLHGNVIMMRNAEQNVLALDALVSIRVLMPAALDPYVVSSTINHFALAQMDTQVTLLYDARPVSF